MEPKVQADPRDSEISLTRIYLPFAMVLSIGGVLIASGYAVGGVMSGISHNKSAVEIRLGAIEREITAIKDILMERQAGIQARKAR